MSEIYRFIRAEKAHFTVVLLCAVLGVARSSHYAWEAAEQARSVRGCEDLARVHEITVIHVASRRTYGVPRIHAELRRQGRLVNRKRVERLMREHGIAGHSRRTQRRSLTRADRKAAPAPDPIGRDFTATAPGLRVVGDITYIPTIEGWLYLATWLDLATREVIGYSMADHHRAGLVVDALGRAARLGLLENGCIIHTDRGSEPGVEPGATSGIHSGVPSGADRNWTLPPKLLCFWLNHRSLPLSRTPVTRLLSMSMPSRIT
ncbi:IS3 family transposase [Streptomyces montanus]|uniref:IS3 family transposase n=1 Tax=Streptomyces montanus TaxID=2580423 RepID=A0A5R9FVZ5_9ACTN|nr:IS3 family transposase [Streptomyces montanus]TLS46146.1 IS3 family transposase [Streptomyces montanus]